MIFNTFAYYLLFLIPVAILFRVTSYQTRLRVLIFAASTFFVYFSLTGIGGVPGAICLGLFIWESIFSRTYRPKSIFCWIGVFQSILILVIFKYWNYLTGLLFSLRGGKNPWVWHNAFLPLGVSFFTFEFIHYAVDRYRGLAPEGTLEEYLAFIMFFPTMVAGPIKRYQDFLPKLRAAHADATSWSCGITRILAGLVKKFGVADLMTAFTVHLNRADIGQANRPILLLWLLAYGIKIYFDFSGYSDIAIGSAQLLGVKVPENFNWPYLRSNISEFWRNWHISLSRWLTDYVFIPLGGSRVRPYQIYSNLLVTMFISGVWHGAGTNFAVWGLWHGVMLSVHRFWRTHRGIERTSTGARVLATATTFAFVNLGWAFFCMDLPTAGFFFRRLLVI